MAQPLADPATPPRQRLDSLDLLRGAGILGILLMNTQSMGLPASSYFNPTDYGDQSTPNYLTWIIIHVFADTKFITIFSTLFGAGILLQADRSAARGLSPAAVHYRRMFVLLLIGLAHAYLLWFGDIIVIYCLSGIILFPLRRLPAPALITVGVCFISVATLIAYAEHMQICEPVLKLEQLSDHITDGVYGTDFELLAYRSGWRAEMRNRPWFSLDNETTSFALHWFWRCGGAMLIGMGLHKARFFHAAWPPTAYGSIAAFTIPLGAMLTILGVLFNAMYDWNWEDLSFPGTQFNYWGSLVSSLGYMSVGTLLAIRAAQFPSGLTAKLLAPIRAVGRTALSNYILQSLICTTIFYGHAFGAYGHVSRMGLAAITILIWAFQLTISSLYTRRFQQGPLEYLWHRAVYFR